MATFARRRDAGEVDDAQDVAGGNFGHLFVERDGVVGLRIQKGNADEVSARYYIML